MSKVKEIIKQKFGQRHIYRRIARCVNLSVSTVCYYATKIKEAGLAVWPLPEGLSDADLQQILFGDPTKEKKETQATQVDWDRVHKELARKGVTRQLVWQELFETNPNFMSYSQFCVYYRRYQKTLERPVMRQTYKAGEKCFVDYAGMTMPLIDPVTGEITKAQIFIGAQGVSSYTYAEATLTQKTRDWLGSTGRMFKFYGGVNMDIIPDNLRSGVKQADRYDPELNPAYEEFCRHYNVAILPARAASPRDKATVESAVGFVTRKVLAPLRHRKFYSLGELNQAIWERLEILNHGSFQKKDTSRYALFMEIDKPALQPLPKMPYEYADWKKVKVNIDYHFAYDNHNYSVPYIHCGKHVMIRATAKTVECLFNNEVIAVHTRSYSKYNCTTLEAHMPKSHYEHAKWTPEAIAEGAKKIGLHTSALLTSIIKGKDFPQQGIRPCLGVLRLAKVYGNERLEKASEKALLVGMKRSHEIRYMLKNNLEDMSVETVAKPPPPQHENIRGPNYYQQPSTERTLSC